MDKINATVLQGMVVDAIERFVYEPSEQDVRKQVLARVQVFMDSIVAARVIEPIEVRVSTDPNVPPHEIRLNFWRGDKQITDAEDL